MNKIAFCFLVYSNIDHEGLWSEWFSDVDKSKYTVYISQSHPKKTAPVNQFKDNIIPTRDTQYYHKSIVGCQIDMISTALKDDNITHIIFLSGSHIPVKKFSYVYDNIKLTTMHDVTPRNMDREFKAQGLDRNFRNLVKSSQWTVITRSHAEDIVFTLDDNTLDEICPRGKYDISAAPDEIIIQSYLLSNNPKSDFNIIQNDPESSPTFEYWSYNRKYKYNNHFTTTNPSDWIERIKTYYIVEQEELDHLINDCSCFFIRKVDADCVVIDCGEPRQDYEKELNKLYIDLFTVIFALAKGEFKRVPIKLLNVLNRIQVTTLTDHILPRIT